MKRREFLSGAGALASVTVAGCSGNESSSTESSESSTSEGNNDGGDTDRTVSLGDRNYEQIEYEINVGEELSGVLASIEESADQVVVNRINTFEEDFTRSDSYCSVQDNGIVTLSSTQEEREEYNVPEEDEVDVYGVNISLECDGELLGQEATEIARQIFSRFFTVESEFFYDPRNEELSGEDSPEGPISEFIRNFNYDELFNEINLEVEAQNGTGSVRYVDPDREQEGYSLARLLDSLEEGYESENLNQGTAVRNQVGEDFEFS